jgi:hypothetical protein
MPTFPTSNPSSRSSSPSGNEFPQIETLSDGQTSTPAHGSEMDVDELEDTSSENTPDTSSENTPITADKGKGKAHQHEDRVGIHPARLSPEFIGSLSVNQNTELRQYLRTLRAEMEGSYTLIQRHTLDKLHEAKLLKDRWTSLDDLHHQLA